MPSAAPRHQNARGDLRPTGSQVQVVLWPWVGSLRFGLRMAVDQFELVTDFVPRGDQPRAIAELIERFKRGERQLTLLGATGTGKTATAAWLIQALQRPTLVISHNKTLAAQLCSEFRAFFPKSAVEYFVSYYDYYQPEAYLPQTDLYIEKDISINEEIDRLRHRATQAIMTRRDSIIVASVSCIYGLGSPEDYREATLTLRKGETLDRDALLRRLVEMLYERNDVALSRGKFRVRGDLIEVCTVEETIYRIDLFGEEIERLSEIDAVTGSTVQEHEAIVLFPARHFVTPEHRIDGALTAIEAELADRASEFRSQGKLLEAQRLEQRTKFDLEMIRELGYCPGIENYSRHFDARPAGTPPHTLVDFFPKDYLLIIDESHVTIPQVQGMYEGDRSRKENLVTYGFRLPSAFDNRPLKFFEFEGKVGQVLYMSATPGPYELARSDAVVEQIIRPTGLVDPAIIVRPVKGQVDDLVAEIRRRVKRKERTLVTTLTKKMAEDLAEYLSELDIKVHYLHSEVETLKRIELLRDLRIGTVDVIVGVNLLREGLDLPEVSLVAILDADKEGYLRSETSLIQTIGRAARNVFGQVIMYAEEVTDSMRRAIDETTRRRKIQLAFNQAHGITPETVRKEVRAILEEPGEIAEATTMGWGRYAKDQLPIILANLEEEMLMAANELEFERAAQIRDRIAKLRGAQEQLGERLAYRAAQRRKKMAERLHKRA